MFALLAYKRPSLTEHRYQLAFEIRSFGCFNGFNVERAFTTLPGGHLGTGFDIIFDDLLENGALPADYWTGGVEKTGRENTQEMLRKWDFSKVTVRGGTGAPQGAAHEDGLRFNREEEMARPWECIAIGYMCYDVGNMNLTYQYHHEPDTANPGLLRPPQWVGLPSLDHASMNAQTMNLLNQGRINESFYDHHQGDQRMSTRVPTRNESFLQSFLISMDKTPTVAKYSLKSSRMFIAITYASSCMHGTYELVGSERPSGLAISYLQTWRNTVEKQWITQRNAKDLAAVECLRLLAQGWPRDLDPMPMVARFCNNGDDSDILAFAGDNFTLYATKFGVFNCADLYRRSDSMLIEGRYNKGNQSICLRDNLRDKMNAKGEVFNAKFTAAASTVMTMLNYFAHVQRRPATEDAAHYVNNWLEGHPVRTEAEIRQIVAEHSQSITNWLIAEAEFDYKPLFKKFRGVVALLPNFRIERQSHLELNPNPLGFREWIAQAEGRIGEATTAEGASPEQSDPVLGQTANAGATLDGAVRAAGGPDVWIEPGAPILQLGGLDGDEPEDLAYLQELAIPADWQQVQTIPFQTAPVLHGDLDVARHGVRPDINRVVYHGAEAVEMREAMADAQRAGTAAINRLFD